MEVADIRHLFDYTEWANARTIDAAEQLSAEHLHRDFHISHNSIFETLLHMAGAEWIWLERWNGRSPAKAEAWSLWTIDACPNLAALKTSWAEVVARRTQYLADLGEGKFNSEQFFQLLNGDSSSILLAHQMQHVVNHATLHRGQVVGMIRQLGIDPPSTDMIFYLRSDVSPK